MIITAIKQQIRNKERYSIYVEKKYAFSLSAEALLASGITSGQSLTESQLAAYKKQSADDKAYGLALAFVARRMRSEGELSSYFRRKQYDPDIVDDIMQRLRGARLVDDWEFARRWIENRRLLRHASTRKLKLELRQKHISEDIVRTVLSEDETDERDVLRAIVDKKRRNSRYQEDQKLISYLARQGFKYDDIKAVLDPE